MFVGTKKQAQESVAEEATGSACPASTSAGSGGMLTTSPPSNKRLQRPQGAEAMEQTGGFEGRTPPKRS